MTTTATTATTTVELAEDFQSLGTNIFVALGTDGNLYFRINPAKDYGETGGGNQKVASTNGNSLVDIIAARFPNFYVGINAYVKTVFKKREEKTTK